MLQYRIKVIILIALSIGLTLAYQNCGSGGGGGDSGGGAGSAAAISKLDNVVAISAGEDSACALKTDGTVWCWGDNHYGQLGTNVGSALASVNAVKVSGIATATGISVGTYFACASLSGGTVRCWGSGTLGRLGNGSQANSTAPVEVYGITNASSSIATGISHACVVLTTGAIKCWGSAGGGELGDGNFSGISSCNVPNDCNLTPVNVSGISSAQKVTAGYSTSCALLADTSVHCWGSNLTGDLGNGNTTGVNVPSSAAATNITQVSTGVHFHSCAVDTSQSVKCWGLNRYAELGSGSASGPVTCGSYACSTSALTVSGITNATMVSSGHSFSCALLADQSIKCWGISNGPNTCGYDSCSFAPTTVAGISGAIAIAAGTDFACALTSAQTIKCWRNTGSSSQTTPSELSQNSNTTDLPLPGGGGSGGGSTGPHMLIVTKIGSPYNPDTTGAPGTGAGNVYSAPAGISCTNCLSTYAIFAHNQVVNLSITITSGLSATLGGDCASSTVTMDADKYCTVKFNSGAYDVLPSTNTKYNLTVSKTGSGSGSITSTTLPYSGTAINCGTGCSRTYMHGAGVALTAVANAGSTFLSWAGDCASTTSTISAGMSANKICTAVFTTP